MRTVVTIGGAPVTVELLHAGETVEAVVDGTHYRATVTREGEEWRLALPERTLALTVIRERDHVWVAVAGEVFRCEARPETRTGGGAAGARSPHVKAPMPGKVLDVLVEPGQEVAAGDALVVLEAMKMETVATAEAAARVRAVHVAAGAMVEPGQTLVDLEFA